MMPIILTYLRRYKVNKVWEFSRQYEFILICLRIYVCFFPKCLDEFTEKCKKQKRLWVDNIITGYYFQERIRFKREKNHVTNMKSHDEHLIFQPK